jgi:hypothetical protein
MIDLLLVAEAPPASLDRYFYFPNVGEHDSLFRYVTRVALARTPTRDNKVELLRELRDRGIFLTDLSPDPLDGHPLTSFLPGLIRRCRGLDPRAIILIKASVYDAAYRELASAGLPVIDERVPFPGSGQQTRFVAAFKRALRRAQAMRR